MSAHRPGRSGVESRLFIIENLLLEPSSFVPEIRLYTAHPGSGLGRFLEHGQDAPPFWAYPWAGGLALARYVLDHPRVVAGRRVLDLGAGSGLVGIAAARAGASTVIAADTDANAIAAIGLNAAANGVAIEAVLADPTETAPGGIDMILAGDVFYEAPLGRRVSAFLESAPPLGIDVLVGDPFRIGLPRERLALVQEFLVPDFGAGRDRRSVRCGVFRLGMAGETASPAAGR